MQTYTMPREAFDLLVEALGEKQKAEIFATAMESQLDFIREQADEEIAEKKEMIKIEIRDELKKELVTREIFEERFKIIDEKFKSLVTEMNIRFDGVDEKFKVIDEKFKSLNFKLNIFIAIALIALTFANPAFVQLIGKLF